MHVDKVTKVIKILKMINMITNVGRVYSRLPQSLAYRTGASGGHVPACGRIISSTASLRAWVEVIPARSVNLPVLPRPKAAPRPYPGPRLHAPFFFRRAFINPPCPSGVSPSLPPPFDQGERRALRVVSVKLFRMIHGPLP